MPIFKDRLEQAGFDRKRLEARAIIVNLMKGGLSAQELIEIVREVAETLSGDQGRYVQQDQSAPVPAQPPMPEGQKSPAIDGLHLCADGHPIASGADQTPDVHNGPGVVCPPARTPVSPMPDPKRVVHQDHVTAARHSSPELRGQPETSRNAHPQGAPKAREPSHAYLRAAAQSRLETVRTALYLHKTSTGRWYGDICPYEFPGMKRDGKFAEIFEHVFGPFNDKQSRMKCGDLLNAKQQDEVWRLLNA